jgi:hypothetical protein
MAMDKGKLAATGETGLLSTGLSEQADSGTASSRHKNADSS